MTIPEWPSVHEIFNEYGGFVWRTLRYLGAPEADVPDLCQEVFLVVHRRIGDFRGNSSLRTWLYGICIRVAHGHRRRAYVRREAAVESPPEVCIPAPQTAQLERDRARATLQRILDGLDEPKRTVFVLYEIEHLTLKEIAEAVGCPLQTAYSRLAAARKHVVRAAEQLGETQA